MKMLNNINLQIEIPSTGMMVKEDYELIQFMDCCLYVLPLDSNVSNELIKEEFYKLICCDNNFINHYDVEFLEDLPRMDNHPKLKTALNNNRYSLLMGMNEFVSTTGKKYLLLQSTDNSLISDLTSMIQISEQITTESVKELMFQHAMFSPKTFIKNTQHLWESNEFWEKYFLLHFEEILNGDVAGIDSCLPKEIRGKVGVDKILTHKKILELQNKFIQNVLELKRNEKNLNARKEIKIVLDSLNFKNPDTISYLASKPQDAIEEFYEDMSPIKIAERSKLTMEVRKYGKIDNKKKNDGHYRLYLLKDNQEQLVHFKRKSSFIVYIIYLMDIVSSETLDTLDMVDYEKPFRNLYRDVYGSGGKDDFDNLIGNGNSSQKMMRLCINDIRNAIGDACEILHEKFVSPFVLKDSSSHLYIKRENVKIDERLFQIINRPL